MDGRDTGVVDGGRKGIGRTPLGGRGSLQEQKGLRLPGQAGHGETKQHSDTGPAV